MSWADLAIGGAQSVGSYIVQMAEAKNKRAWQKYNNAMVMLQRGQNQNTLTDNENMARERTQEEAFLIRRSEYITKASAEVAAAATGTTGRSVNMVMFDIGRNAAVADRDRQRDFQLQQLGTDNARRQTELQAKMSLDLTDIPNPNPFSAALGFMSNNGESLSALFKGELSNKATPRTTGPDSHDPYSKRNLGL